MTPDGVPDAYAVVCWQSNFGLSCMAAAAGSTSTSQEQLTLHTLQRFIGSHEPIVAAIKRCFTSCDSSFQKARQFEKNPESLQLLVTCAAARICCECLLHEFVKRKNG